MPPAVPWTPETARIAGAKGNATRQRLARERKANKHAIAQPQTGLFSGKVLARTQSAMTKLQDHIDKQLSRKDVDALQLQQLFTALARAADVEFAYANRPKPGNWRAAGPPKSAQVASVEPSFSVPSVEHPPPPAADATKESLLPPGPVPPMAPGGGGEG